MANNYNIFRVEPDFEKGILPITPRFVYEHPELLIVYSYVYFDETNEEYGYHNEPLTSLNYSEGEFFFGTYDEAFVVTSDGLDSPFILD